MRLYRQGSDYGYVPASIRPYLRMPAGHPEGFHEAAGEPPSNARMDDPAATRRVRSPAFRPPWHRGRRRRDGFPGCRRSERAEGDLWVEVPRGDRAGGGLEMKDTLVRFSVAISGELLRRFDQYRRSIATESERGGPGPDACGG